MIRGFCLIAADFPSGVELSEDFTFRKFLTFMWLLLFAKLGGGEALEIAL